MILLFSIVLTKAQTVKMLSSGNRISLRGLSVVDDNTIWVSGSNGTVGKSIDAGNNWTWMKVKGFDSTDFRDIEAFNDSTAIIMGISEPAYILKTTNGGKDWKIVYENKTKGMFLDAMDFADDKTGFVIGDPINDHFFKASTLDGGEHWYPYPEKFAPVADSAEACFASSGTNIRSTKKLKVVLVSGGKKSNILVGNKKYSLPLLQGKESTGANSVAVNQKKIIVVGGDFTTKDATDGNCCYSLNTGKTWSIPTTAPHGYRSCVEYLHDKVWISCGLNGSDISTDDGNTWNWISKDSFNACRKAKKGTAVFFAGGNGRIGKLIW
ncbi:MAG: oxidoreductase [Ferruginibacter sp.]